MKTAFITGGSSGIGQAIVHMLKDDEWNIIAPTHSELDLSDLPKISHAVDELTGDVPVIHAVIHVAGVWHDAEVAFSKDLEDYTDAQIIDTMNVGLTGCMLVLRSLLPKVARDGVVIGITGTFADGASGWLPYYTSKRGLEDMLVGLSQDYPKGPRVYGVSPADTATKSYEKFFPQYAAEAQPTGAVADAVEKLLAKSSVPSGTIVEIRDSKPHPGFHK